MGGNSTGAETGVPAVELPIGAVIRIDGQKLRVVGEPLVGHRGWSPFDELEQYLELAVERLADAAHLRLEMPVDAEVEVLGSCRGPE